jgi:cytochrome c oxidase cbb3-type subunit 3
MCSRFRELTLCAFVMLALAACERESRKFSDPSLSATPLNTLSQSEIQPGGPAPPHATAVHSPYDYNAYAVNQGKQLYEWFNCKGCHADGGGAIGPPLMDDKWIYGSAPENIFATIVEGRPNGMPSFRGKIPTQQVWQLVAYVRSMSGQLPKDASPSRSDHLFTGKSEQSRPDVQPVPSAPPPPAH